MGRVAAAPTVPNFLEDSKMKIKALFGLALSFILIASANAAEKKLPA